MQTIVAVLMYLGLVHSPSTNSNFSDKATVSANINVNGTPVIIDIQEF